MKKEMFVLIQYVKKHNFCSLKTREKLHNKTQNNGNTLSCVHGSINMWLYWK